MLQMLGCLKYVFQWNQNNDYVSVYSTGLGSGYYKVNLTLHHRDNACGRELMFNKIEINSKQDEYFHLLYASKQFHWKESANTIIF